ncbi:uncharacterized protein EDB93DRAFT_614890 [Suillus bovinus]|uniref:uncharacterized protein n=1 Tax=Suillus bovinus TaxID=48563 RepID=UPI001B873A63|nr:uncharacterized protein EDB93DRAFT_614890 [Suillus bovinus]KAG2142317.1 hypothetical protein EDB93DRAFT_614890 [Suillus bovinus]
MIIARAQSCPLFVCLRVFRKHLYNPFTASTAFRVRHNHELATRCRRRVLPCPSFTHEPGPLQIIILVCCLVKQDKLKSQKKWTIRASALTLSAPQCSWISTNQTVTSFPASSLQYFIQPFTLLFTRSWFSMLARNINQQFNAVRLLTVMNHNRYVSQAASGCTMCQLLLLLIMPRICNQQSQYMKYAAGFSIRGRLGRSCCL